MAKLDINTASLEELTEIDGIGERRAQSILNHRDSAKGFMSLEELTKLPYFEDLTAADYDTLSEQLEVRSFTTQAIQGGGKRSS